jgi:hypothetical protein
LPAAAAVLHHSLHDRRIFETWPMHSLLISATVRTFSPMTFQDCPEDPKAITSSIESGVAVCRAPDGTCARASECEQFLAGYRRCLKPFQPFVIGDGFENSTVMSVIAACRQLPLKKASASVATECTKRQQSARTECGTVVRHVVTHSVACRIPYLNPASGRCTVVVSTYCRAV